MSPDRYHPLLRVLHWSIALLIIAALFLGTFVMAPMANTNPGKIFALLKHMLAGLLILALTLFRIFVRKNTTRPAPVSSGIEFADMIVPFVHRVFDLLVFTMIGSGIAMILLAGVPDAIIGSGALPASFDHIPLHTLHVWIGRVFMTLIGLHVVGALYHQFICRDRLFSRMWLFAGKTQSQTSN